MELKSIEGGAGRIEQSDEAMVTIAEHLSDYANGSIDALYALGGLLTRPEATVAAST